MKNTIRLRQLAFLAICIVLMGGCMKDREVPIVSTINVTSIETTTAVTGGIVTSDGGTDVTARGVCWSIDPEPTTENKKTSDGAGTGSFISVITGLTENTIYYVRAYASNKIGTAYGNENSFITNYIVVTPSLPTITSAIITSILPTSAVTGGTVNSDGGDSVTARGICYGIKVDPTTQNLTTIDGSGEGTFTSNLTGLTPGTTYFARAYASNTAGTSYGTQFSFTTPVDENYTGLQRANFPGGPRYGAASFAIGSKIYMGLGFIDANGQNIVRDLWEWDQSTNIWTKKADYPGNSVANVVSFSIGTRGYVGTGQAFNTTNYTNEFWEYDPARDGWAQKTSLPSTPARAWAVGFSIGNKGYIGTGAIAGAISNSYYKEFWEWDQATNQWTRKADFEGPARGGAIAFSIGNKGYIGTGSNGNTTLFRDFWEWDQATNIWTRKADFGGSARSGAVGFSIGNKGYIGTGLDVSTAYNDFWVWDQGTNSWERSTDFQGGIRAAAVGLSIGNKAYIGIGSLSNATLNDLWEYIP